MGAEVLEVAFEKSTKVKALKTFLDQNTIEDYEGVILLDADNVMDRDFLLKSSALLEDGLQMVQGLRTASKIHNASSLYDAIAERANHKMLCEAANMLGLSGKLSGSAMLMSPALFQEIIPRLSAIGGFDKEMELILTQKKRHIYYDASLVVFDEKTDSFQTFSRQRGRWLESQYSFFFRFFKSGLSALLNGNPDHFHKVFQLALPPRVILPVALMFIGLLFLVAGYSELFWTCGVLLQLNILTYLILTPTDWLISHGFKLILSLPMLVISTFRALGFMKRSGKEFIHTKKRLNNYAV
jgi:cellulose synthase/poly-beta-1,6-N-acetylglucosamine synthase-like glycosyltransferase